MADGIIINTGTGPTVAAEMIGTALHQKVKLVIGASGTATVLALGQTAMAGSFPVVVATDQSTLSVKVVAFTPGGTQDVSITNAVGIDQVTNNANEVVVKSGTITTVSAITTGTVSIAGTPTVTVSTMPVISATGVTIASITTGTISGSVSIINTPTITVSTMPVISATGVTIASITTGTISGSISVINTPTVTVSAMPTVNVAQSGTWNIATVSTVLGTVTVSGGGGGVQYPIDSTAIAATGTGTLIVGIQEGATITKGLALTTTGGLVVGVMPQVGGGVQYPIASTNLNTGTGTLVIGIQDGATIGRGLALTTTGGLIIGTMPAVGGGVQYSRGDTSAAATGTGTLMIGLDATTARGLALTATGGVASVASITTILAMPVISATNVTIASITTGTISGSISVINTPTVTVSTMPVISATNITVASITAATITTVLAMPVLSAANITVASLTTGTISGTVTVLGVAPVYPVGTSGMAATASGYIMMGMQSGATIGRGLALTTSGQQLIQMTTGTCDISNTPTVTVTGMPPVYSIGTTAIAATGTGLLVIGVQSGATACRGLAVTTTGQPIVQIATGTVTVASITTGTCDARPITSTVMVGGYFGTHHASGWAAYAVCTTSGVATLIKTSGAHTLYVSDIMISANVAMGVTWNSATTAMGQVYLTTQGGFALALASPMILTSAQSLTFTSSVSGSCAAFAAGWTVT